MFIFSFDKMIFSSRLKDLREKNKIKQKEIADGLGLTQTQISDLENGKTTTSLERIYALADYFGVSIDYLVGRSDEPKVYTKKDGE
ncbi:transcriptional regulator [Clostridia bacterium]|nr:transcriptional regulator [Clostridia bacterium]